MEESSEYKDTERAREREREREKLGIERESWFVSGWIPNTVES